MQVDEAPNGQAQQSQLAIVQLQPPQQHKQSVGSRSDDGLHKLSRGLAREAAHNLVLIYRGSGAHDLARHIMMRYLTV
jgi:hypothetical protein